MSKIEITSEIGKLEEEKRARVARQHKARRKSESECMLNKWRLQEKSRNTKRTREGKEPIKITSTERERRLKARASCICLQLREKYKKPSLTIPEVMFELGLSGREVGGIYLTNKLPDMTLESVARYYVEFIEGSVEDV